MQKGAGRQFEKEPLRATNILFCGCGLKLFSPHAHKLTLSQFLIYIVDRNECFHYVLLARLIVKIPPVASFFCLNSLTGTMKDPAVDLLGLNTITGIKTLFLTPRV